ncbi:unnamed protein product [Bursaphelenchus okinawaensis]|uniref:Uncharacterized protein n=1 Tax=Bursaphelenchus okinawaensis TaxID=465554 RepID=A0A811L749_9BILA|nr:unnamed protein product [Bursaphelenchus okinawaensis]CAG9117071.1 unnamed protein product [Bursaphelenchus okinawaensis]
MTTKSATFYSKAHYSHAKDTPETHSFITDDVKEDRRDKAVGMWLMFCSTVLFWCLAIGGTTRLSGAGLSITRWDPIGTIIPPLNENQWKSELDLYKLTPEYKLKHATPVLQSDLPLHEFKSMWMMAYLHRLLSHLLAIVFFVPCAYFWYKGKFNSKAKKLMIACGVLLALQAVVGWFVVKSGLESDATGTTKLICPYRLALHLLLGFFLYMLLLLPAFAHLFKPVYYVEAAQSIKAYRGLVSFTITSMLITVTFGAFVAGLEAGKIYNTWPLYNGNFFPQNMNVERPMIRNFFENPGTVQFLHRNMAYITLGLVIFTYVRGRRMTLHKRALMALNGMLVLGLLQVVVGITNLLLTAPGWLSAVHQTGALSFIGMATWLMFEICHSSK